MPLTCPRALICRERSGRSPRARGASAPGQPTARGQVQRLVGRRCSNVPTGAVRFRRRRRRTPAPAWPVRSPAALRAASFPRERQRAFRPRGPQALLLRLAIGSFGPVRTAADAQLTTAHQRILKNALACGGCAAARHYTLAENDVEPARCSLSPSAPVRPTALCLSCAAEAHVPKPERRDGCNVAPPSGGARGCRPACRRPRLRRTRGFSPGPKPGRDSFRH
jgi:hypothetical protein